MKKTFPIKKITASAILTAFALISFLLESLLPPIFIPGARIGVSNVFILITAILLGAPYAYFAIIVKTVLGSIFAGNLSAVLYSLPSGIIALTVELLALNLANRVSITAISVVGAVINNVIQNVVFCLITGVWEYMTYLPYLVLLGTISGLMIGLIVYFVIKILPESIHDRINK